MKEIYDYGFELGKNAGQNEKHKLRRAITLYSTVDENLREDLVDSIIKVAATICVQVPFNIFDFNTRELQMYILGITNGMGKEVKAE